MEIPELKVPAAPVTPEAPVVPDPIFDKRQEIEKQVLAEAKATFETPEENPEEVSPEVPAEPAKETPKESTDELDRIEQIKKSTQKRINQVIAKQKTAEEKLAEAEAELARLKASPKTPEAPPAPKDDTPPTPEQVEAYIAKMSEEGNHKEVAAATRYLIKLEKELALKEVEEIQAKTQQETARQNAEMKALANDYVAYDETGKPDIKSDMTLANQNGLLFKLAMDYWNDPVRHAERYNNPNVVEGFRRSVADAYRDIQEHRNTNTPKGEQFAEVRRDPRQVLAEPESDGEETVQPAKDTSLSDADKVRAEINARNKNRFIRRVP